MIQAQAAAQAAIAANAQQTAPAQNMPPQNRSVDINDELKDLSMDFNDIDENLRC